MRGWCRLAAGVGGDPRDLITRVCARVTVDRILFLAAGAGLLAITYLLVAASPGKYTIQGLITGRGGPGHNPAGAGFLHGPASAQAQAAQQHAADMRQFLVQSGISLAIMTVAAIVLGWLVAGRILRPLQVMTATTRRI